MGAEPRSRMFPTRYAWLVFSIRKGTGVPKSWAVEQKATSFASLKGLRWLSIVKKHTCLCSGTPNCWLVASKVASKAYHQLSRAYPLFHGSWSPKPILLARTKLFGQQRNSARRLMPWRLSIMLPRCCSRRLARICRAWSGLVSIALPVAERLGPIIIRWLSLVPPGIGSRSNRHWAVVRSGPFTSQAKTQGGSQATT